MQRLIAELHRLFPLPAATPPDTGTDGAGPVAVPWPRQLSGEGWIPLQPVDAQGNTRLLGVGFHGVARGQGAAHGAAMLQLARWLMEELGLPEGAFSVNGRNGFELWLPLAAPLPVREAHEFLRLLKDAQLPDLKSIRLWPAAPEPSTAAADRLCLPPGRHADTGLWGVFIAPGLAPSFDEEAGIDIAPNLDKQAELLSRLQPMAPADFASALQRLRQRAGRTAEAQAPTPLADAPEAAAALAAPETGARGGPCAVPAALAPLAGQREQLLSALMRPAPAVPAPFEALTQLLHGGWRAGRLYLLRGVAAGATATLAALAVERAAALGHPALYLSYALSRTQFVSAALARRLGLDAWRIESGALTPQEAERLGAGLDAWLAQVGPCLELREVAPGSALAEAAAWVEAARAAVPSCTPLVVVDPLHLAGTGVAAIDAHPDAAQRAAALAAACKHLARSTGAAVIAVAHAARILEDVADALEAAADVAIRLQPQSTPVQPGADASRPVRLVLHSRLDGEGVLALRHEPARQALDLGDG